MYSVCDDLKGRVSPFRHLRIKARLPAPRSLSQATTSFIACNRQGIHHVHLFTCPYNVGPCMSIRDRHKYKFSLLCLLIQQIFYPKCAFHLSVNYTLKENFTSSRLLKNENYTYLKLDCEVALDKCSGNSRMVEDDGIEPTTPCLQSRCSPS